MCFPQGQVAEVMVIFNSLYKGKFMCSSRVMGYLTCRQGNLGFIKDSGNSKLVSGGAEL